VAAGATGRAGVTDATGATLRDWTRHAVTAVGKGHAELPAERGSAGFGLGTACRKLVRFFPLGRASRGDLGGSESPRLPPGPWRQSRAAARVSRRSLSSDSSTAAVLPLLRTDWPSSRASRA
jgi:hypothetical protein